MNKIGVRYESADKVVVHEILEGDNAGYRLEGAFFVAWANKGISRRTLIVPTSRLIDANQIIP